MTMGASSAAAHPSPQGWGEIEMYVSRISNFSDNGIDYIWMSNKGKVQNKGFLAWDEIHTANAFKRDLLGVDLICIQLQRKQRGRN